MNCRDPDECRRHGAADDDRAFSCPVCAAPPRRVTVILDTRKGKKVRLFECQCGELVWDD